MPDFDDDDFAAGMGERDPDDEHIDVLTDLSDPKPVPGYGPDALSDEAFQALIDKRGFTPEQIGQKIAASKVAKRKADEARESEEFTRFFESELIAKGYDPETKTWSHPSEESSEDGERAEDPLLAQPESVVDRLDETQWSELQALLDARSGGASMPAPIDPDVIAAYKLLTGAEREEGVSDYGYRGG